MSDKTTPCPFCGSNDISDGEVLSENPNGTTTTQSRCNECGALGPEAGLQAGEVDYGSEKAIEGWNRRASTPSALPVEGAAITSESATEVKEPHPEDIEGNLAAGRRERKAALEGAEAIESAAAACEEYASGMKGEQAEGAMECAKRLRGNIHRLKAWAIQDARAPVQEDGGYVQAFYELAQLMGIGPQPASPATVWRAVPVAWVKSSEWEEAKTKRQSFNGWRHNYGDCDMVLYLNPPASPSEGGGDPHASAQEAADRTPEELFDGHGVYTMLSPDAKRRTSGENVSDVLDAVLRFMSRNDFLSTGLAPHAPAPVQINSKPATAQSLLAALIDIYDDAQNNAPEHRCYVESAWPDVLKEARTFLAAPVQAAPTEPTCERCDLPPSAHDWNHWCDNQSFTTPAPVAPQIPANVRDNAACDSSVSHKAAPVAADTLTEPVTDEDVEAAILAAHGYEAPHVTRLYMRLALESFASRRAPARAIPVQGHAPEPLQAASPEPFGYWHQGHTEEESSFFKHGDFSNVACDRCIKLYPHPPGIAGTAQSVDKP